MKIFDPLPSSLICSFVSSSAASTPPSPYLVRPAASSFALAVVPRVLRSRHKSTLVLLASPSTQLCPLVCCQHISSFPFLFTFSLFLHTPRCINALICVLLLSLLSSFLSALHSIVSVLSPHSPLHHRISLPACLVAFVARLALALHPAG